MIDAPPLLNKRALLKLGWTPGLIEAILEKPDLVKHHSKGRCHWVEHLFARDRVDEGMKDPRFLARVAERSKRLVNAEVKRIDITKRYADWREALPEACAGLHSLNRYAKYRSCSPLHKHEIYRLKHEFVELLYGQGYCTSSWIHRQNVEAQPCRECSGDGEICDHCGGSGIWRAARVLEFWCFRFLIAGKPYRWHQPVALVNFSPKESVPPQDWQGLGAQEKPLAIPATRFAAVKELLRWVIDRAATEADASPDVTLPAISIPSPGGPDREDLLPF